MALLTFLVLNLALDVVDSVGRLNLQSDGLASQGLDEDLHVVSKARTKPKLSEINVKWNEGLSSFKG